MHHSSAEVLASALDEKHVLGKKYLELIHYRTVVPVEIRYYLSKKPNFHQRIMNSLPGAILLSRIDWKAIVRGVVWLRQERALMR